MSLTNDFLRGRQPSVVIKLKLENCLNVLKIVSKEPVAILLSIKDCLIGTIAVFVMASSLFTICYTRSLQNLPFCPITASGSNFKPRNTQCIPTFKPDLKFGRLP